MDSAYWTRINWVQIKVKAILVKYEGKLPNAAWQGNRLPWLTPLCWKNSSKACAAIHQIYARCQLPILIKRHTLPQIPSNSRMWSWLHC